MRIFREGDVSKVLGPAPELFTLSYYKLNVRNIEFQNLCNSMNRCITKIIPIKFKLFN